MEFVTGMLLSSIAGEGQETREKLERVIGCIMQQMSSDISTVSDSIVSEDVVHEFQTAMMSLVMIVASSISDTNKSTDEETADTADGDSDNGGKLFYRVVLYSELNSSNYLAALGLKCLICHGEDGAMIFCPCALCSFKTTDLTRAGHRECFEQAFASQDGKCPHCRHVPTAEEKSFRAAGILPRVFLFIYVMSCSLYMWVRALHLPGLFAVSLSHCRYRRRKLMLPPRTRWHLHWVCSTSSRCSKSEYGRFQSLCDRHGTKYILTSDLFVYFEFF